MPKGDLTFVGWIEDIADLPIEYPKKTIAFYFNGQKKNLQAWKFTSSQTKSIMSDADVVNLLAMSDEELFQLKGVTTVVNIKDVLTNPLKTFTAIGKSTVQDILDASEISSQRRSTEIANLTKGKTKGLTGRDLSSPPSGPISILNKTSGGGFYDMSPYIEETIDPKTGKKKKVSKMLLRGTYKFAIKDKDRQTDDRKLLEESELYGDKHILAKQYRPYAHMSSSMEGLAAYSDTQSARELFRNQSITDFNRITLTELGIDLDKVLPTVTGKQTSTGTLIDALKPYGGDIDKFLANDGKLADRLETTLGIPITLWSNEEIETLSQIVRAEYYINNIDQHFKLWSPKYTEKSHVLNRKVLGMDISVPIPTGLAEKDQLKVFKRENEQTKAILEAQFAIQENSKKIMQRIYQQQEATAFDLLHKEYLRKQGRPPNSKLLPSEIKMLRQNAKEAASLAVDRMTSAQKALMATHNLYFAGTAKNLLMAIENEDYVSILLITSKFAGTLPFLEIPFVPGNYYVAHIMDPIIQTAIKTLKINEAKNAIGKYTGLNFQSGSKFMGLGMQNNVAIEWSRDVGTQTFAYQSWINSEDALGLFGFTIYDPKKKKELFSTNYSAFDVVKSSWGNGDVGIDLEKSLKYSKYKPKDLFANPDLLSEFLHDLKDQTELIISGQKITDAGLANLVKTLKLDEIVDGEYKNFQLFLQNLNLFDNHGKHLLEGMVINGNVPNDEIWNILNNFYSTGKVSQLAGKYAGYLNMYNRYANYVRSFFYKQIILGQYSGNSRLLLGLIKTSAPLRSVLEKFGMTSELGISGAVAQWPGIKWLVNSGDWLKSKAFIEFFESKFGTKAAVLFLSKFGGAALAKSIGFLLSGAAGIVSGGISWLITSLGDVAWQFVKNLHKGLDTALHAAEESFKGTAKVFIKVVLYPLLGCCGCILIIPLVIIPSMLTSYTNTGGGGYTDTAESKYIEVDKTATPDISHRTIKYKIKVTNITGESGDVDQQPITIGKFKDTLSYIPDCGAGTTQTYDDNNPNGFTGTLDKPTRDLMLEFLNRTIEPEKSIESELTLTLPSSLDINSVNSTYSNSVEVAAKEDSTRSAFDSVATNINNGGCMKCPSGWPLHDHFVMTQGPYRDGHQAHTTYKEEAVDLAANSGVPIFATHAGTAVSAQRNDYGNFVVVTSNTNPGVKTLYAHMKDISSNLKPDGKYGTPVQVNKGAVLGYVGNTGGSRGVHLHYEFKKPLVECIPGEKLRMVNLNNSMYPGSYIPVDHDIEGCFEVSQCNYTGP